MVYLNLPTFKHRFMVNVDTYTIHRTFGKGIPLDFSHGGGRNPPLPGSFILAAERSAARKGVLRIPGVAIRPGGFGKAWTVQVDGELMTQFLLPCN